MSWLRRGAVLGAFALTTALPALGAVPAAAATPLRADLPTASVQVAGGNFGSVVADSSHGRVFVSSPSSDAIAVVTFAGKPVETIQDIYGAAGMVLVGSTLYVAESTDGAIVAINPHTYSREVIARGIDQPFWLAYAGDRLWVSAATTSGAGSGLLDAIDLTTHQIVTSKYTFYDPPDLATSPGDPNSLFVTLDGISPGVVTRFFIDDGVLDAGPHTTTDDYDNIEQIAVTPSGQAVIPASGAPYDFEELTAKTMQLDGVIYPGSAYPSSVATSAGNGGVLATGIEHGGTSPDVFVDPIGIPKAFAEFATPSVSDDDGVLPHGLALSNGGGSLFVVSEASDGLELSVFSVPKS